MVLGTFLKDQNAILDYRIDWSLWLDGDTISTSTWTLESGITKATDTFTDTITTIWLSGGTLGTTYTVSNRITTANGRTEDRTIEVSVVDR